MIFLIGCNASVSDISDFDDSDVAAIVNGEEITIGELRFLYNDDEILGNLDGTIKAKLAEQEVKKMNIDLSQKLEEIKDSYGITKNIYPPEDDDSDYAVKTREFAETQSAKFGMEPEEYFEKHSEKTQEMILYITAYIEDKIGRPTDNNIEEYNEKADEILNKLVKENEDSVQKLIK